MEITVDIIGDKEFVRGLARLNSFEAPELIRKAIRYTAGTPARRVISQKVREIYRVKAARVKKDIHRTKFEDGGFKATIRTSYDPMTLMQYGFKQTARGGKYQIFKSGASQFQAGAFKAVGSNGNVLPWVRIGKTRFPVRTMYGPSLAGMITGNSAKGPDLRRSITNELSKVLRKRIDKNMGDMLRGFGRVTS